MAFCKAWDSENETWALRRWLSDLDINKAPSEQGAITSGWCGWEAGEKLEGQEKEPVVERDLEKEKGTWECGLFRDTYRRGHQPRGLKEQRAHGGGKSQEKEKQRLCAFKKIIKLIYLLLVRMCASAHAQQESGGQRTTCRNRKHLHGPQGSNSSCQACWQVPSPAEPFHQPCFCL